MGVMIPVGVGCVCQCDDDPEEWAGKWWTEGSPHDAEHEQAHYDGLPWGKLGPKKVKEARQA